jgi:hypothetical protein
VPRAHRPDIGIRVPTARRHEPHRRGHCAAAGSDGVDLLRRQHRPDCGCDCAHHPPGRVDPVEIRLRIERRQLPHRRRDRRGGHRGHRSVRVLAHAAPGGGAALPDVPRVPDGP